MKNINLDKLEEKYNSLLAMASVLGIQKPGNKKYIQILNKMWEMQQKLAITKFSNL